MNPEPLSKEELGKLLTATLPVDADRAVLHAFVRGQQQLLNYLANALAKQTLSILDIRENQVSHKEAIEHVADLATGHGEDDFAHKPGLVGFEEPKVIV